MEKQERAHRTHIVVMPFPAQGHINPMIQFSKRLASKGLKVTLASTVSDTKSVQAQAGSVRVEPISVKFNEDIKLDDIKAYVEHVKDIVSKGLPEFIEKQNTSGYPVTCLVYDSTMPWALEIAKRLGLTGASFVTQSCSVLAICYNVHQGLLRIPVESPNVTITGLPPLGTFDLPSLFIDDELNPTFILNHVHSLFSNFEEADWIFFNTFDSLEREVVNWMASQWPIKTIGPTIPSMYIDKRVEDGKDYGLNLFKPNVDACMEWLDAKEIGSVVYISFGSSATLREGQMEELAWGLKRSNNYFLWVVRESEGNKLPSNFVDETWEKGLVVSWCPQLRVLAHKAVGCFLTHCGWNSTLEALSLGVPMVAMPQFRDQTTNAKFVVDVWQVGVRAKVDEKGIVKKEVIEVCIREVMEGERGNEIKMNAARWKELAKEAVDEGGSSDKNIEEFVANLVCT